MNIGEGAHITAASPKGPRYDASLTAAQRVHFSNGIWLCGTCHRIVDGDEATFTIDLLRTWKAEAEAFAKGVVTSPSGLMMESARFLEVRQSGTRRPSLRFIGITELEVQSVSEVIEATDAVDIVYSDPIERALVELRERDKDPDAHAARNPRRLEIKADQRGEIAAFYHSLNKRLLRRASLIAEHNSAGINRLLEVLDELGASAAERWAAVSTFGALAALRMVLALKQGYGWGETEPFPWFEAMELETTIGPSLLPLVPKVSHTGSATFGFQYWCVARVGSERASEYAMFPLKEVLPLFKKGIRGNRAAFFTWVLPQIFDSDRVAIKHAEGKVALETWEPFVLNGSRQEWWHRAHDCPWGDIKEP